MTIHGWRGAVFAAAIALGGTASAQTSGTSSSGTSGSSARSGGKLDKSLTEAAQKLHAANQGEIHAAQLATQTAQSQEVKSFAQHMMTDHQENDQQLQQLAQTMGATLQGDAFDKKHKKSQEEMQKVQAKTGAEFDKAYMKLMVDEHKKDAKEVESAAKDAKKQKQTELASFLDQTHAKMQMHLQEAQRIEGSLGKGGASAQSGASGASGQGTGSSSSGSAGSSSSADRATGTGSPSASDSSGAGMSGGTSSDTSGTGSSGRSSSGTKTAPENAPSGGSPGPAGSGSSSSGSSTGGTRTP